MDYEAIRNYTDTEVRKVGGKYILVEVKYKKILTDAEALGIINMGITNRTDLNQVRSLRANIR